jgi:lipopolysaccharide transport system ATP-binding protein
MYVRLAFAVAAHLEPEILLVDEVLAVGDVGFQKKCLGKMGEVAGEGRTVLFVSHNMGAIAELCTRCIALSQGRLIGDGVPQVIVGNYLAEDSSQGEIDLLDWSLDRKGDGPMYVSYLATRNCDGEVRSDFLYGQPITFDLEIVGRAGNSCIIGLAIRDSRGVLVLHLNNTDDDRELILTGDRTHVQVHLPNNVLNDGDYYVTVWLGDTLDTLHDRVGNCLRFSVNSSALGFIRSQGCVRVPASWEVS